MTDRYYELMNKAYWDDEDWSDYNDIARNDDDIPTRSELSTWGIGFDADDTVCESWCM